LACVNAINQVSERYGVTLTEQGHLRQLNSEDVANRITEKQELAGWSEKFQQTTFSFLKVWKELDQKYIQPGQRSAVIASGINGFLSIYKDPHSYIMPLAMYEEVIANSESRSANVGFIARRMKNTLLVRKVFEGSPAELAGFHKGDVILSINGQQISDLLPTQINDLLKMRDMNRIGFQILRKQGPNARNEKKYIELLRSEKTYPSVVSRVIDGRRRLGLIVLHKFSKNVCNMTKKEIIQLKEENVQGLILDLRDNPGGQVEEAACVANLFLSKGTFLFETRYLDSSKPADRYVADENPMYRGSLAVLINSGSASAAEIVAGVLKDQNRARLIGERSFGKGSFQDGRVWGANSKIAFFETEGLYYFASGWTPQLVGLTPDIQVDFNNAENQREEELFINPISPIDNWSAPQNLAWLMDRGCDEETSLINASGTWAGDQDPQVEKAQALLSCGEKHDRHGSL